ncbi:MAG: NAD-dependent epimerase/dehydratase family protein [Phycisphaeraceae bacterium]|nr:NAD-dependent epimerase/dehydratase family protein [Phycisphaeraceae bacterium]
MRADRRRFLQCAFVAGMAFPLAGVARSITATARPTTEPPKPRTILILGGTGFLGPHIVDAARARGHTVTLFNRGITEKRKQIPVDGVEKLLGDRDPEKGDGLKALEEGTWDAVIDTSGYYPRIVKASATLLAPRVGQYVFISSLSAYKDNSTPGDDESAEVATIADPAVEEMGQAYQNYGALKALCEQAAEQAMPGRTTSIRAGYIVGPGDPTDRFTYWPVRVSEGGVVLCPGTPNDPVMFIDVRDLAAWIVLCIENRTTGVFNAMGPAAPYTSGQLLKACQKAAGKESTLTWVGFEDLERAGVEEGVLPILLRAQGENAGFHMRQNARAVGAGLTFRPAEETCRDILAWWPGEVARRTRITNEMIEQAKSEGKEPPRMANPSNLRAGISREREAEVLKTVMESPKS